MQANDIFNWISTASTKLLTLVAGVDQSVHKMEANHPLVEQAIELAKKELLQFPAFATVETMGTAILGFAQTMSSLTQVAGTQAVQQKTSVS